MDHQTKECMMYLFRMIDDLKKEVDDLKKEVDDLKKEVDDLKLSLTEMEVNEQGVVKRVKRVNELDRIKKFLDGQDGFDSNWPV